MANVTLRLVKGTPLTNSEVDNNFSNLNIFKTEIGGDLGGNVFYPRVIGIQGRNVSNVAPANLQVLSWSASANTWTPSNAASNYGELQTKPSVNVIITGDLTGSSNVVLVNTDTNVVSVNVSYDFDNIDSRYLKLDNPTTQYVNSYVNFQGNVTFGGNVTTIGANNLIISDNFIYINDGSTNTNVDIGIVGNYNDGTYAHSGFFRDASDNGTWKIFEGYLPEPDAAVNLDTDNASFRLANLAINKLTANNIITGNILPSANLTYNLGSPSLRFKDLYLSGSTINLGSATLSATNQSVSISAIDNTPIGATTRNTAAFTTLTANQSVTFTGLTESSNTTSGILVISGGMGVKGNVSAANISGNLHYGSYVTNKPALNVLFTGDVTGAGNVRLSSVDTNSLSIALTVQPNSVALGTDTTGNYTDRVLVGAGLTVSGTADEGNVITVAHLDTSSVSNVSSDNSNGIVLQDISLGFDTFGHVTSGTVATANLDTRYLQLSSGGFQTVTGTVTFNDNIVVSGNVTGNLRATGNVVSSGAVFGNFLTDQVRQTQLTLNSTSNTTLNLSLSSNFYINMTGNSNIAFGNVSISLGSSGYIFIKQDVSGGRYFTLPAECKTPGGRSIVQVTSTGALSLITYYVVDSSTIIVNYIGDFK